MRDTTYVEVVGAQLNSLTKTLANPPSEGLTSAEVALIAATIGASAAILAQVVIFLLTRIKETGNLRKQLIADERRIAILLTEYYKELVMHKVHKQYWYRTSEIFSSEAEDSKDSHNRHFISNQRSFETLTKIKETISEYFKTVTHFTILSDENKKINTLLDEIKHFKPRKASTFSEVKTYDELLLAQSLEEEKLNEVYRHYSDCFDRIHLQMIKKK
jgi:hypothetical protein